jgi:hypothetical protein
MQFIGLTLLLITLLDGDSRQFTSAENGISNRQVAYHLPSVEKLADRRPASPVEQDPSYQVRQVMFDLSDHVWKSRVLLIFAPCRSNQNYCRFRCDLEFQNDGAVERDLCLVKIFERGVSYAGHDPLATSAVEQLRDQFAVKPGGSAFILVGKDGSVKLRRSQLRVADLFAVIDAMPMRRAEMAESKAR